MQIKTCVSIVLAISVIILIIPILAYSTHRNSAQMPVISLIQAYNFTRIIAFGDLHGDYDALISVLAISD